MHKFLVLISFILIQYAASANSLKLQKLQIEYLTNPLGLQEQKPRFSWSFKSPEDGVFNQKQAAYRILVASSAGVLSKHIGDVWDSRWETSSETLNIPFNGKELLSDRSYYWKVQVKDERGKLSEWSAPALWSTGIIESQEWKAKWIGSDILFDPSQKDCNIPDPWLRKEVNLTQIPNRAILHLSSVGFHELYINGHKVGDDVLATAVTDHTKRARYLSYDIAPYLKKGKNIVGIWLGTGWSIHGPYVSDHRPNTPIALAQVSFYSAKDPQLTEKPFLTLITDDSWQVKASPSRLLGIWDSNRMGGEHWDANLEDSNWNLPNNLSEGWKFATVYQPKLKLSAQQVERNRLQQPIFPVSIEDLGNETYRVDMGVNFAGWIAVKMMGEPFQEVDFSFSEREQNTETFGLYSRYTFNKTGKGTFKNKFNYSSGRWITIKGLAQAPTLKDITGWLVRTDFQKASSFSSSDSLHNWLQKTVNWTFENLSLGGFIVDCPQRERLGYGGDAHATAETGMLNYAMGAFYTKWMEDWRDVSGTESIVGNMYDPTFARHQPMSGRILNNGILPHTAPTYMGGGGPAWGGIVVTLPWYFYEQFGDTRILKENFQLIKNWISFMDENTKDGLLQRFGGRWDFLGDWLWPQATAEGMNNDSPENLCFNNSYRVYNLRIAAKIAQTLGYAKEAQTWAQKADAFAEIIHNRFYNSHDHSYADGSMSNLTAALLADIAPVALRKSIFQRLETEIIQHKKGHIHVGITGGALLFKLLRAYNRNDLLFTMTSQTSYPSWGYMKKNQATTIWEMWEKDLPGHSLLHSSYLYPGAWYIEGVGGIKSPKNGYESFVIQPPGANETTLTFAHVNYDSPRGTIQANWSRENGFLQLNLSIPPNTEALLKLDSSEKLRSHPQLQLQHEKEGKLTYKLKSGNYKFSSN